MATLLTPISRGDDALPPPSQQNPLVDLGAYACVQSRSGSQDPNRTVVVAISGGGYRSANFALGALLALEQVRELDGNSLHSEIDYYSTVSGGGLAAAASMMAQDRFPNAATPLLDWASYDGHRHLKVMRSNHTARLILSMLRPVNILTRRTRGDDLQMRLDKDLLYTNNGSLVLRDIFIRKDREEAHNGKYPYWFINTTDMSSGEIVPFTPKRLEQERIRKYWHGRRQTVGTASTYYDVPVALGLRSSMNFPVAIPPTTLGLDAVPHDDARFLYLSDGGLADNIGVVVAVAILNAESDQEDCANLQDATTGPRKRLLIIIDAFRGIAQPSTSLRRPPGPLRSVMRGLSLPLAAHRHRIREDYSEESAHRLSVLDAMAESDDLGVIYIHMDLEEQARDTRTNLYITAKRQRELICAGFRQTLLVFGIKPPDTREIGEYLARCEDDVEDTDEIGGPVGILAFGKEEKEDLMVRMGGQVLQSASKTISELVNVQADILHHIGAAVGAYRGGVHQETIATAVLEMRNEVVRNEENRVDSSNRIDLDSEEEQLFIRYMTSLELLVQHVTTFTTSPADSQVDAPVQEVTGILGWFLQLFRAMFSSDSDEDRSNEALVEKEELRKNWKGTLCTLVSVLESARRFRCEVNARIGARLAPEEAKHCVSLDEGRGGLETSIATLEVAHARLLAEAIQMRADGAPLGSMADIDLYGDLSSFFRLTQVPRRLLSSVVRQERALIGEELTRTRNVFRSVARRLEEYEEPDPILEVQEVRDRYRGSKIFRALEELKERLEAVAERLAKTDWTTAESLCILANEKAEIESGSAELEDVWQYEGDRLVWGVPEDIWEAFDRAEAESRVARLKSQLKELTRVIGAAINRWPDSQYRDRLKYDEFLSFSYDYYSDLANFAIDKERIPYARAEVSGRCDKADVGGVEVKAERG